MPGKLRAMMQWDKLLSPVRLGRSRLETPQPQRSPFQRDYDRMVFSSAFRRMQDKTQVVPLAESDYVRTRLTHSLEAACVGRSLGTAIGADLAACPEGFHPSDVGAIVAAACLAHDVGNPPFGHSGEDAIRHWFLTSPHAAFFRDHLSPEEAADFARFEGNAQGFRVLTRLEMPDNPGGLQLTCATLGAFAKYPLASGTPLPPGEKGASGKKFSFFCSEADLFAEVADRTGLLPRGAGRWCRHPLAFIVEAADDICYRLVDFEDGVRLGLLPYEKVRDAFVEVIGSSRDLERAQGMHAEKERIEFLRAQAIGSAVDQVRAAFRDRQEALLAGEFDEPLIDCTPMAAAMEEIVQHSWETIYASPRKAEIEAAGFEVIGGLLDLFVSAVEDYCACGKPSPRTRTLLRIVPEPFIGPGGEPDAHPYTRLQRMTDFVSGMTDSHAVSLYKKLRGISLPGK